MGYHNRQSDETTAGNQWWIILVFSLIIAVVGVILLPNYMNCLASGKYTQCLSNFITIEKALKKYCDNNDEKYPPTLTALTPGYLQTIPTCAASKSNKGYIDSYRVSRDLKAYTFYCPGKNHTGVGMKENFPQCNSGDGIVVQRR